MFDQTYEQCQNVTPSTQTDFISIPPSTVFALWQRLKKCYLRCDPIFRLVAIWQQVHLLENEELQDFFIDDIANHPLALKFPPALSYSYKVIKTIIVEGEMRHLNITDKVTSKFCEIMGVISNEQHKENVHQIFHHKSYLVCRTTTGNKVLPEECNSFVSWPQDETCSTTTNESVYGGTAGMSPHHSASKITHKEEESAVPAMRILSAKDEVMAVTVRLHDWRNEVGLRMWIAGLFLSEFLMLFGKTGVKVPFEVVQTHPLTELQHAKEDTSTLSTSPSDDQTSNNAPVGEGARPGRSVEMLMNNPYFSYKNENQKVQPYPQLLFIPPMKGCRVIELGSGVGLSSIIAIKSCEMKSFVASDHLPSVLFNLRYNLNKINGIQIRDSHRIHQTSNDELIIPSAPDPTLSSPSDNLTTSYLYASDSSDNGSQLSDCYDPPPPCAASSPQSSIIPSSSRMSSVSPRECLSNQIHSFSQTEQSQNFDMSQISNCAPRSIISPDLPQSVYPSSHPTEVSVNLIDWEMTSSDALRMFGSYLGQKDIQTGPPSSSSSSSCDESNGPVDVILISDGVYDPDICVSLTRAIRLILEGSRDKRREEAGGKEDLGHSNTDNNKIHNTIIEDDIDIEILKHPYVLMTTKKRTEEVYDVFIQHCHKEKIRVRVVNFNPHSCEYLVDGALDGKDIYMLILDLVD